jgi:hypothetical protein
MDVCSSGRSSKLHATRYSFWTQAQTLRGLEGRRTGAVNPCGVGTSLATYGRRQRPQESTVRPIAANTLSTAEAQSPAGENVGKIVDFVLDTERGSVVYAVLAVGGVLGVGAKMLAIPPGQLRFDAGRGCLEIGIDTAALDSLPGIDRTNAPESAEDALLGRAPTGAPQPAARGQG